MRPIHYALVLIVALSLVYAEVPNLKFLDWDDNVNVYANPLLNPVTSETLKHYWTKPFFALYIPVTHTVWTGIAYFAQGPPDERGITLNPTAFHVANLILHVLCALVVFAILRLLLKHDWGAFVGAALFALHPVQVEPVCWITGMKDLAGASLGLLALWQYLTWAAKTQDQDATGHSRKRLYLSVGLFALAALAKQTVIGLIVVAWALDHLVLKRDAREAARSLLPWLPVAIGGAIIAKIFNGPDPEAVQLWARPFVAGDALAFYLGKLVWPVGLCTDYVRSPAVVIANWWGYATWLVPAALATALIALRKRFPALAASGLIFGVALLPILGLVPFPDQDVTDRYMYLVMLGPALALGWTVARLNAPRLNLLVALMLAALAIGSSFQTLHWDNTTTLFVRVLAVSPRSWVAHTMIANELLNHDHPIEAQAYLAEALRLKPDSAEVQDSLGRSLLMLGRPEEAVEHYRRVTSLRPESGAGHYGLANALEAAGQHEEARAEYDEAMRLMADGR
jgi:hypothetical protein